jgi:hypothetical protein
VINNKLECFDYGKHLQPSPIFASNVRHFLSEWDTIDFPLQASSLNSKQISGELTGKYALAYSSIGVQEKTL